MSRQTVQVLRIGILGALLLTVPPLAHAGTADCAAITGNLVQNCGFEAGFAGWTQLPLSAPASSMVWPFAGIGVGAASTGLGIDQLISFPFSIPPNSGQLALAFGGPGEVTQSIPVTPGDVYRVGLYFDASQPSRLDYLCVAIGLTTEVATKGPQGCTAAIPGTSSYSDGQVVASQSGYTQGTFTFTAASLNILLTFADYPCAVNTFGGVGGGEQPLINPIDCTDPASSSWLTTSTPLYPFLLDDISLVDITPAAGSAPEPGSISLLLTGFALLVWRRRRTQ